MNWSRNPSDLHMLGKSPLGGRGGLEEGGVGGMNSLWGTKFTVKAESGGHDILRTGGEGDGGRGRVDYGHDFFSREGGVFRVSHYCRIVLVCLSWSCRPQSGKGILYFFDVIINHCCI